MKIQLGDRSQSEKAKYFESIIKLRCLKGKKRGFRALEKGEGRARKVEMKPSLLPLVRSRVQQRVWRGIFGIRYLTRNIVRDSGNRKISRRDTEFDRGIRRNLCTGCGIRDRDDRSLAGYEFRKENRIRYRDDRSSGCRIFLVKKVWECRIRIVASRATFLDSRSWSLKIV